MYVYIVACFLYSLPKKQVFVPVVSAMTAIGRDCLVLASNTQWPDIQPLVSRCQIIPLTSRNGQTDRRADNYNFVYTI